MAESEKPKGNNKIIVIAATVILIAAILAGVYIYKEKQDEKVITLSIGDKSFSATIKE